MVDVLKYSPSTFSSSSTSFYGNLFHLRCKTPSEQMSGPIFLANPSQFPFQNYLSNLPGKRWIGRCPGDPPRLLDVAQAPYGIHRRIIHQELSRPVAARQEFLQTFRQKTSKTTSNASNSAYLTVQAQSTKLCDSLSKHISVKSEPLRATNHLNPNTTSTLTSWQRYWTSTHAERRRKEASESEPIFYLPKSQKQISPIPSETEFVVLRDSPITFSRNSSKSDDRTSSSSSRKLLSSITADENPISSSTTFDFHSLMADSVESPFKTSDEEEEAKQLMEKSFLFSSSSSQSKSDTQIINEVADAQKSNEEILPKLYEFAAPIITKKTKKTQQRQRIRPKSNEKNENTTFSKRFHPIATSSKISIQSNSSTKKKKMVASKTTATLLTKPGEKNWDEPYIGKREDPPTPPCSPTAQMFSTPFERNEDEQQQEKQLESCVF